MKIRIPSTKVCEEFHLTYELKGAQKGIDILTKYYGIPKMRIVVDGRRVGNEDEACYYENKAYFSKRWLNRSNVLHEVFHHILENKGLEMSEKKEEMEADVFVRKIIRNKLRSDS